MKRYVLILTVLFVGVALAQLQPVIPFDTMAQRVEPGQLHTATEAWVILDTTASAGDEPNDLGVTERTYATVVAAAEGGDAKITIYGDDASERLIMSDWNGVRLRASGITDDGTVTYQIYLGTLPVGATDCELVNAGQLAFTIGTQAAVTATYEMADTLTITNDTTWTADWGSNSPTGELVAEAMVDLMGANIIVAVPTVASADSRLHARGF